VPATDCGTGSGAGGGECFTGNIAATCPATGNSAMIDPP
jgi:hypothetical protein